MTKKVSRSRALAPILSIAVILFLIVISFSYFKGAFKQNRGEVLAQDISYLAHIFTQINNTAGILSFDFTKNRIDFLNIKKDGFIGSEVGSMNLINPKKWEGPYIRNIPLHEEDYMVLRTKKGYFITPADDVRLPNGKIIGQDIILDQNSDIEHMMHEEGLLSFSGRPLAAKIVVSGGYSQMLPFIMPEDSE